MYFVMITVKTIAKLNPDGSDKLKWKFTKLAVVFYVLQKRKNLVILHDVVLQRRKEMYQEL